MIVFSSAQLSSKKRTHKNPPRNITKIADIIAISIAHNDTHSFTLVCFLLFFSIDKISVCITHIFTSKFLNILVVVKHGILWIPHL